MGRKVSTSLPEILRCPSLKLPSEKFQSWHVLSLQTMILLTFMIRINFKQRRHKFLLTLIESAIVRIFIIFFVETNFGKYWLNQV
jgi:hypothetical protein